jgi:hypothetical protein
MKKLICVILLVLAASCATTNFDVEKHLDEKHNVSEK